MLASMPESYFITIKLITFERFAEIGDYFLKGRMRYNLRDAFLRLIPSFIFDIVFDCILLTRKVLYDNPFTDFRKPPSSL